MSEVPPNSAPQSAPLRDNKFKTRWRQISKAAAALFASKGFHRTTTKDIASAADVSEGTLYNYFKNKDDIMFSILSQLTEAQNATSQADVPISTKAREFFTRYLTLRKKHMDQNRTMMQAIISEILSNDELRERYYRQILAPDMQLMESQLQMRLDLEQIRDIDLPMTTRVFTGLLMGLFLLQAAGDPLVDEKWDELAELTTSIIFDGISLQGR